MDRFSSLRKNQWLFGAITLFCFCSCSIYKLSPKEKKWIPYKKGQKIVFISPEGKTDTIFIMREETFRHTAPMAVISDVNHSITITAKVPDPFTNVGDLHFTHSYQPIVQLHTNDSETNATIQLEVYGHRFVSEKNLFDKLGNGIPMTLGRKMYQDIIVFECNDKKVCADPKAIRRLYWSRQYGIVQYTLGEEEWNLSEIIK